MLLKLILGAVIIIGCLLIVLWVVWRYVEKRRAAALQYSSTDLIVTVEQYIEIIERLGHSHKGALRVHTDNIVKRLKVISAHAATQDSGVIKTADLTGHVLPLAVKLLKSWIQCLELPQELYVSGIASAESGLDFITELLDKKLIAIYEHKNLDISTDVEALKMQTALLGR